MESVTMTIAEKLIHQIPSLNPKIIGELVFSMSRMVEERAPQTKRFMMPDGSAMTHDGAGWRAEARFLPDNVGVGYCACDSTKSKTYREHSCGPIRETKEQALKDMRDQGRKCVRYVLTDGALYVEEPNDSE
jgi:hypothetical protein